MNLCGLAASCLVLALGAAGCGGQAHQGPRQAPLSVHVALDVSGSMDGASIDSARKAVEALVDRLGPDDELSLVTFANEATLVVPRGPVGPRRAPIVWQIHAIAAGGGTNLSAGLDRAYGQARASTADGALVLLLTDGRANEGDTDQDSLVARSAAARQDGIRTSTFGLGSDFDGPLLELLADRGEGRAYELDDPAKIAPAFVREIDAR